MNDAGNAFVCAPPVLALLGMLAATPLYAATFTVTKTADTNDGACNADCSLREAVIAANALADADTINLPAGTYRLDLTGFNEDSAAAGDLDILNPVTIAGAAAATAIVDGNATDRVFDVVNSVVADLSNLTIRNGNALVTDGGAIRNNNGNVTLTNVTASGNTAKKGGALINDGGSGTFNLYETTLSGNTAEDGGAIHSTGAGNRVWATNVTVTGNTATTEGGGLLIDHVFLTNATVTLNTAPPGKGSGISDRGGQPATLLNAIVANNTNDDCTGSFVDAGGNLDSDGTCGVTLTANPLLGPLQDNGGPTRTHALLSGSPAIEAGINVGCPATDQRGVPRPDGAVCDIGAYEGEVNLVSGKVFEDADFAGTASAYDGGAGDQALANVDVELYTSTDTYIGSSTTDGTGMYSFYAIDGSYKVRIRSATIGDSNTQPTGTFNGACGVTDPGSGPGCVVADQTWGNGAAAYGGQSATVDDTATDNDAGPGDTWIAVTLSGADIVGVDFGFAYNLIVNTLNAGQGSLRQFIENANAIGAAGGTTASHSEFRIPVSDPGFNAGTGVFTITPGSALPSIIDASSTIDGTTQTANVGNTNTAVLGVGGTVGVDSLGLSQVNGPEIEIQGQSAINYGLQVAANNTTVRGIAIYGFGSFLIHADIFVNNGVNGGTFEFNVLGTRAHMFSDPGAGSRSWAGFTSDGADNWLLQHNVIGYTETRGAIAQNASQNWTIRDNEFRDNAQVDIGGDNLALDGATPGTVSGNLLVGAASQGLVISNSNTNVIVNNTFERNGVGHTTAAPIQDGALTLRSTADNVTIDRNIFDSNYGPGVMINNGSVDTVITRNSFFDNGSIFSRDGSPPTNQVGIDLQLPADNNNLGTSPFYNTNDDGDGDGGGNDIFNFAVIDKAQIIGANLIVNGFAAAGATVEFFISDGDPSDFGEGQSYLFSAVEGSVADSDGGNGFYGPGAINGVVQGDESPIPRYRFTVPVASLPVPLTAADKLVATATLAAQTSEFGARAPVDVGTIDGTIFVDIAGDGLTDGPIGPLPNPFESGARIELWRDGGDGIPDGGDDLYQTFTTSSGADGTYQFDGLRNGTYWVTVDAGGVNRGPYNGGYSGADAWPEQTYGPAGAATFDGSVWSFAPAAGAVYGGARWDLSDRFPPTNSLPTAEHIGRVIVADNDTGNFDFGFSFNVVTTTRGGSGAADPGTPAGQRTVQGSLRQFLTNANAQSGSNAMRFVPAAPTNGSDGGGNDWWRVNVTALLPVITDTATTVDGAAFSSADGVTAVDPNDANLGAGETVGVDGLFTTPILDPELEIEVSGVNYGIQIDDAVSTIIRNISIWKSDENDLVIGDAGGASFTDTLIEQNVIGTPPHRFDASFQATGNDHIDVFADADSGTLQNNLIGFGNGGGFSADLGATPWLVFQNEIRGIGRAPGWGPSQDAVGDGAPGIIIRGNLLADNAGGGVESNQMPGGFTIEQNTLRNNGAVSPETFSIRLMGTTGNTVTKNIFDAGNGAAIVVVSDLAAPPYAASEANLISQNRFINDSAAIAIDLLDAGSPAIEHDNGDGISLNDGGTVANDGNDGLDFPVIDSVVLGASLTVAGFSRPGVTIEFYKAAGAVNDQNTGGTAHGEGVLYLFSATEGSGADTDATTGSYASPDYGADPAANRFRFTVAAPAGLSLGDAVSAIAIDGSNNTSEFGPNLVSTAGSSIAGTVFEDNAGDGLPGAQAIGDAANPTVGSVTVYLYNDSGATTGQPDATDGALGSTTTAGDGSYSFTGLGDGTYWVVVDSKMLAADTNVWGEQSYGPTGAWCADGAGGTTEGIGSAGACYGGRRVDPVPANPASDNLTTWHSGAEHLGEIVVAGSDVTGVDFGFSFNVVTTTRGGGATDDDGANPRTVQGSLRQFIGNANAIAGANPMRFVPAEPANASAGAHSWWQIPVSLAQPQISGAATLVDGVAYSFADGATVIDTNTAAIGAGAATGVSGTYNTPQLDPELELRGDGVVTIGLEIRSTGDGSAIRDVAINAFAINAVRLIGFVPDDLDNATLENTVIGTSPASFTDDPLLSTGRALFARDLSNATIRNNLAGWLDWGFQVQFDTFDTLIETNEIRACTIHGMYIAGSAGTGQQPARITIRGNLIESSGTNAIHTFQALNQLTITENTLRLSGSRAVSLYGVQNTVSSNIIADNSGTGLLITGDVSPTHPAVSQTRISQNRFGNNGGLAIDLVNTGTNPDGITINDDLDADNGGANELHNFPVIESAVIAAGNLTVTGLARPGVDLEFYESAGAANDHNSGGTPHGEGIAYLFTATEGSGADTDATTDSYTSPDYGTDTAAERFRFVVAAPAGLAIGEELSATSIDTTNDTSEFGPNVVVSAPYNIIKRAFLPDGTPVGDGSALPVGVGFKFLLYIDNKAGATNDASIRDVLDPLFGYQAGTLQVDNSVAECAAAACTPAEETAIFASAIASPVLTDVIDADIASFNGTDTIDVGNQFVANGQLNIAANTVLAVVFSAKIQ